MTKKSFTGKKKFIYAKFFTHFSKHLPEYLPCGKKHRSNTKDSAVGKEIKGAKMILAFMEKFHIYKYPGNKKEKWIM